MLKLLVLLQALLTAEETPPETYHWPLDQSRVLTSSFAEYRPGRFHMGIDLRTGPIGKKVYAAADGYIERIRCSPFGYGKAVYLRFDDGNSAIYAHLNDFIPSLRERIRGTQHQRESYTVDIYLKPNEFPITKAQLIGYSGQTGIGVPHLHWEIRDKNNHPVNPKSLNIDWPDSTRPIFRKALVVPRGTESTVNGDVLGLELDVKNTAKGQWTTQPVRASGSISFGVDVVDPANRGATKLGVYTIETKTKTTPIFFMKHEQVTYAHANDSAVTYHPYYGGRILTQWKWPHNQSELVSHTKLDGLYQVEEETTEVTIQIKDFHGNQATLTIPILPEPPTDKKNLGIAFPTNDLLFDQFGTDLIITARLQTSSEHTPMLVESGEPNAQIPFRLIGANTYRAIYDAKHTNATTLLGVTHPKFNEDNTPPHHQFIILKRGTPLPPTEINGVKVSAPMDAAYGQLFITAAPVESEPSGELTIHGSAYMLWPANAPLDQSITVSLPLPKDVKNPQIYQKTTKKWRWKPSKLNTDRIEFKTKSLGTFQIMEDAKQPRLSIRHPKTDLTTPEKRPEIKAIVDDPGSTIKRWEVRLNNDWLLTEYDPEQKFIRWEQDEDLPVGQHTLHFLVEDEAGNIARKERTLTISNVR